MEQLTNNVFSTLASGVDSSTTTFTVTDATGFPSSGDYRILVGTELCLVTARSGTSLTVTRGIESSTPNSHSSGAPVYLVLTSGALRQLFNDYDMFGLSSNRPTAGVVGRKYHCSDYDLVWRDNGSTWDLIHPCFVPSSAALDLSTWTKISTTLNDDPTIINGAISSLVSKPQSEGGTEITGWVLEKPSTPFTAILTLRVFSPQYSAISLGVQVGLGLINSIYTKAHIMSWSRFYRAETVDYTSVTTDTTAKFDDYYLSGQVFYLKYSESSTEWQISFSIDKINWRELAPVTKDGAFTASHLLIQHCVRVAISASRTEFLGLEIS